MTCVYKAPNEINGDQSVVTMKYYRIVNLDCDAFIAYHAVYNQSKVYWNASVDICDLRPWFEATVSSSFLLGRLLRLPVSTGWWVPETVCLHRHDEYRFKKITKER
jgi:hypothetical protein